MRGCLLVSWGALAVRARWFVYYIAVFVCAFVKCSAAARALLLPRQLLCVCVPCQLLRVRVCVPCQLLRMRVYVPCQLLRMRICVPFQLVRVWLPCQILRMRVCVPCQLLRVRVVNLVSCCACAFASYAKYNLQNII
jgi:hypothetical protein